MFLISIIFLLILFFYLIYVKNYITLYFILSILLLFVIFFVRVSTLETYAIYPSAYKNEKLLIMKINFIPNFLKKIILIKKSFIIDTNKRILVFKNYNKEGDLVCYNRAFNNTIVKFDDVISIAIDNLTRSLSFNQFLFTKMI